MRCEDIVERLPWLVNGTLDAGEAQWVRDHLRSCASCRAELGETRWAAALFGAHVSADALVALAWDRASADLDLDLARRHVDQCRACSEELALARESRRFETESPVRRATPVRTLPMHYGGLAAALLVAFAAGLLSRTVMPDRSADEQAGRLSARVGELEQQVRSLREAESALQSEMKSLGEPQPNLPIVEILPDSSVSRSAASRETRIVIPSGARLVALVLGSEKAARGPATAELRSAAGQTVWTGEGLQPSPLGGYTLGLPAALLADGAHTLTLRLPRNGTETYSIRVVHAR